jgi:hypothetical protein
MGTSMDVWNGQSWSIVSTSPYEIYDASCQPGDSLTQCLFLGLYVSGDKYYSDTLHYSGSAWQLSGATSGSTPLPGTTSAYSCGSSTSCFAVGQQTVHVSGDVVTFIEDWNGQKWSTIASPSPNPAHSGLQYDAFFGLSCVSANNCTAVGRANNDLLAEKWNGTKWQVDYFG